MNSPENSESSVSNSDHRSPVWKIIVQSVFGAAVRLHQYRDQRDALLRKVFLDHERLLRDQRCCSE